MRLEAQLKKGYYPLPVTAIPAIATHLQCNPGATIYDPCCGEGEAISLLAEQLEIPRENVYATELDMHRSEVARKRLEGCNFAGPIDFLSAGVYGEVSIVYCNPPFDNEMGGGGRVEHRFIQKSLQLLKTAGVAILILPHSQAISAMTYEIISPWLRNIAIYPVLDATSYNETMIIGVKRGRMANVDWSSRPNRLQMQHRAQGPPLVAGASSGLRFSKYEYTQQELVELVANSPLNNLLERKLVDRQRKFRPPMELTSGHVALLLASGCLDGVVQKPGERPHVVRGSTKKITEKREVIEGSTRKVYETEQIQLTIKVATPFGVTELKDQVKNEDEHGATENISG